MNARQRGAYWTLCCHAWHSTSVGRLLNDRSRLARLAGLTDTEWTEDEQAILAAFDTSDHKFIVQKRLVKEYKKQEALRNQRVEAGLASAKKRSTSVQRTLDERSTDAGRAFNSSSSSSSSDVPPNPPLAVDRQQLPISQIKRRVGDLFKRDNDDPWSYAEQTAICEIAKRPRVIEELEEIEKAWVSGVPYLSTSCGGLLNDWGANLDRARNEVRRLKTNENNARTGKRRTDGNEGTANEGSAHLYRDVGKLGGLQHPIRPETPADANRNSQSTS